MSSGLGSKWGGEEPRLPGSVVRRVNPLGFCFLCKAPHPWAEPCRRLFEIHLKVGCCLPGQPGVQCIAPKGTKSERTNEEPHEGTPRQADNPPTS